MDDSNDASAPRVWPLRTPLTLRGKYWKDGELLQEPLPRYGQTSEQRSESPGEGSLLIDLGSGFFKAGYSSDSKPRLIEETIVAKFKERKGPRTFLLAGDETFADFNARNPINTKTPFDGDIIANPDALENLLDYIFMKCKADTSTQGSTLDREIVMTEVLGSPLQSRKICSEILFELYGVPSVAFGVDSLFSCKSNLCSNGLVLSSGHSSTSLVPVVGGRGVLSQAKKIRWGGSQAVDYLLRLLQLKYPSFPSKVSTNEAQGMLWEHCYVAESYEHDVSKLANADESVVASLDRVVQYPFVAPVIEEKSEEEIAKLNELRRMAGVRLQELARKKRAEKTAAREEELAGLQELQALKGTMKPRDYLERLENEGFEDEGKLDAAIRELNKVLKRSRVNQADVEEEEKEMPSFPLLDIPDSELDAETLQKKRMQRLMKAGYEARIRNKEEKLLEKAREAEAARLDEEARKNDPEKWVGGIRSQYQQLVQRIKERKRLKAQLSDRRSHASQMRMKSLANLASDTPAAKRKRKEVNEDTFGANDDDWAVYRDIRANDSEDEEEDEAQLQTLEGQLLEHDPQFTQDSTLAALQASRGVLISRFLKGVYPVPDVNSYEQHYQLHLNVERVRVPEVLFKPSLAGVDQAGIIEIISDLTDPKTQSPQIREAIMSNILLTGGNTLYPGLVNRLESTLKSTFPTGTAFRVGSSIDAIVDSWKGMSLFAASAEYQSTKVTRAEYNEYGGEYLKENSVSNLYHR